VNVSHPRNREWTVVKLRPHGSEAARYVGTELPAPDGWIAVQARWRYPRVDIGHLVFEPGDVLDEYFALERPYNAFAVYRSSSGFAGWYCNVTHPTIVNGDTIYWHDLYVDVIVRPDGDVIVLDEDELAAARLDERDPALHALILAARDELLARIAAREYPFSEVRE
jgi:hypothetical protein